MQRTDPRLAACCSPAFWRRCISVPATAHAVNFTGPTTIGVGSAPQTVVAGNFNGDADPDLAVVNQGSNNISVLLGGAGASFSAPATYVAGTTPLASWRPTSTATRTRSSRS